MPVRPLLSKEERRLAREEKRTKQRAANLGRAAKFHDARVAWDRANPRTPVLPLSSLRGGISD
jgi:hypothetical protein